MKPINRSSRRNTTLLQWSARITGMIVCGVWVVILILWGTNSEDFTPALIPLMLAIATTMACILIAWRWGVAGGIATSVGAVVVLFAAWYAISASGRTAEWRLLTVTSLPFFVTGLLFILTHRYLHADEC